MLPSSRKLVRASNAAVVLRGGEMVLSDLEKNAAKTKDRLGRPGLSIWAGDDLTPGELLARIHPPLPFARFRLSTVGAIREAGLEVEATLREYHHTIWLPEDYTPELLVLVADRFHPSVSRGVLTGTGHLTTG